jgi:hypothetical protein
MKIDKKTDIYLNKLKNKPKNTLIPLEKYLNRSTRINHRCIRCGNIWNVMPLTLLNIQRNIEGCPYCNKNSRQHIVIKGINDINTIYPHIIPFLTNKDDAYNYSYATDRKILFKCPKCGNIKKAVPRDIASYGYVPCNICGDGTSIPEKFMSNFLSLNNINYIHNKETNWSNKKRYDFIINDNIIETHGLQHYKESKCSSYMNKKNNIENDIYKRELAINNGIQHYIELDWNKCYKLSMNSKMIEACNLWNNGKTIGEICKILDMNMTTIERYLKRGVGSKICNYTEHEARTRRFNNIIIPILSITDNISFNSIKEASLYYNISNISIKNMCENKVDYIISRKDRKKIVLKYK